MKSTLKFSIPLIIAISLISVSAVPSELRRGFEASPESTSDGTNFQPLLVDPTGNFSLGFLRSKPEPGSLSLSVVHLPSVEPLWTASINRPVRWDKKTRFTFNGSLVITDPHTGAFWSTDTENGYRVSIASSSNLQILGSGSGHPVWQSFQFPANTLVEGQNFTSAMTLVSSNSLYTLRLGPDFVGLYAEFNANKPDQIYYKHTAIQAKSTIVNGQGPVYIRVSPDGYLGMYQRGSAPADVQPFSSYQRSVPGIRIIRVESDGNLKAYYWSGSKWEVDYEAIPDTCELPSACGVYGLCRAAGGCTCLDNTTNGTPGACYSGLVSGDFCGAGRVGYTVLRRVGVELPYKELMGFVETASFEKCEDECEANCSCWGVVYSNASRRCYALDYPVQTLLEVGDVGKMGYFKVREGVGKDKMSPGLGVGIGLLCGAVLVGFGAVGFVAYRVWKRRRGVGKFLEGDEIVEPGPYKDLGSESFGSVELSHR